MIPVGILTAAATSSFSYELDLYPGAAVAYSLRKLRSAYTGNCIQVRRSSDNVTQDIGFLNNVLDETALNTFVGANNGFVSIWYDQSTNGRNAIQNTLSNQPQIVSSGAVIKVNLKPALLVDSSDTLVITPSLTMINYIITSFSVFKRTADNITFVFFGANAGMKNYIFQNKYGLDSNNSAITSPIDNTANQTLISAIRDTVAINEQYKNNVLLTKTLQSFVNVNLITNIFSDGSTGSTGWGQEFIIYNLNKNSNISGINTNINSFYNIY